MTDKDLRPVRERLGRVGVWLASLRLAPVDEERRAVRRIEELGYGSIWCGEGIGGKEAFAHQSLLLAATDHIITGTGIANVWARHPATMQGGAATVGAAYPGRFVLGVGISHAPMVERSGQAYQSRWLTWTSTSMLWTRPPRRPLRWEYRSPGSWLRSAPRCWPSPESAPTAPIRTSYRRRIPRWPAK